MTPRGQPGRGAWMRSVEIGRQGHCGAEGARAACSGRRLLNRG